MKRIIALALLICTFAMLAGCSLKCEFCSKIKKTSTVTVQGDEAYICEDCLEKYGADIDELNKE